MKHQTAKPSEPIMRFFTPELYVRFNSADEDEANQANEAWEAAVFAYRKHLDDIRERLPSQVRKLADLCLHDAEFLGCHESIDPLFPPDHERSNQHPPWLATALISIQRDGNMVSLIYVLWDRVRESQLAQDWPFSKARTHWLYDEIDLASHHSDRFLHRILLSDSRILEIPFTSANVHSLPLSPQDGSIGVRQSA
jgi:hypothetical protein